jgi:hypothetical protein
MQGCGNVFWGSKGVEKYFPYQYHQRIKIKGLVSIYSLIL